MWTLAYGYQDDRTPTHGYEPARETAMTAFAGGARARRGAGRGACEVRPFRSRGFIRSFRIPEGELSAANPSCPRSSRSLRWLGDYQESQERTAGQYWRTTGRAVRQIWTTVGTAIKIVRAVMTTFSQRVVPVCRSVAF
jgi:hypothetical protein